MAKKILKFQRPVMTNGSPNLIYIYDQYKITEVQIEMSADEIAEIFGEEYKVYYLCKIVANQRDNTTNITRIKQVKQQVW